MNVEYQVQELYKSYKEYLERVAIETVKIAELLQEEDVSSALQKIVEFSQGMEWLIEAANLLKKHSQPIQLNIDQLIEYIQLVNDGLEKEDYVLVSDIFEYEISEYFRRILGIDEKNEN